MTPGKPASADLSQMLEALPLRGRFLAFPATRGALRDPGLWNQTPSG